MLVRLLLQLETRRLLIIVFMPNLPDDNDNRKKKEKKRKSPRQGMCVAFLIDSIST